MTSLSSQKGNSNQRFCRLSLVGFEGASQVAIEKLIREGDTWLISPTEVADCVIINADQGAMPLASVAQAYHSLYANRCLLVSSQLQAGQGDEFLVPVLGRPFNNTQLLDAIEDVLKNRGTHEDEPFRLNKAEGEEAFHRYIARKQASEQAISSLLKVRSGADTETEALKAKLRKSKVARERYIETHSQSSKVTAVTSQSMPDSTLAEKAQAEKAQAEKARAEKAEAEKVQARASQPKKAPKPTTVTPKAAQEKVQIEKRTQPLVEPDQQSAPKPAPEVVAPKAAVPKAVDQNLKGAVPNKNVRLNKIAKQRSNNGSLKKVTSLKANGRNRLQLVTDEVDIYRCCGNLPDINFADPDERRRIYFDIDGALLNWLPMAVKQGKKQNIPTEIIGLHNGLVYQPHSDTFYCEFGSELLLQYALSRFTFGELSLKPNDHWREAIAVEDANRFVGRADAIIWKVALWTSRGRLAYGLDLDKVYRLSSMPDFTRLICFPYAQQIAELWFEKGFTIVDVVNILKVPQRYVFAFVVAAHSVGILKV